MSNVMIDLETLGTRPGCKILSIGAVVFSENGLGSEFYTEIKLDSQCELFEDIDTVSWWNKQSVKAKGTLFNNSIEKPTLKEALISFNTWLKQVSNINKYGELDVYIWGNGSDFDNVILIAAYNKLEIIPAWSSFNNRCYRTLKNLIPNIKLVRTGIYHNALDDAKSQAKHAIKILNFINRK